MLIKKEEKKMEEKKMEEKKMEDNIGKEKVIRFIS